MKKKFSVGIIGYGRMGQNHAKAIQKIKSCRLKYILDKNDLEKSRNFKDVKFYKNEKDFFENKIDLLIVSTTTDVRFDFTILAIKKGIKKIFLEKPMANSYSKCLKLISFAKKKKISIRVNHQMEHMPIYRDLDKIINSKNLGGLVSMSVNGGNFGLSMNGSHYIYAFLMLTNDIVKEVFCDLENKTLKNPRGKQFRDNSGIILVKTFKNKFLVINSLSEQHHGMSVTYNCKYGIIYINEFNGSLKLNYRKKQYRNFSSTRYGLPEVNKISKLNLSLDLEKTTKDGILDLLKNKYSSNLNWSREVVKVLMLAQQSNIEKKIVKYNSKTNYNNRAFKWA